MLGDSVDLSQTHNDNYFRCMRSLEQSYSEKAAKKDARELRSWHSNVVLQDGNVLEICVHMNIPNTTKGNT